MQRLAHTPYRKVYAPGAAALVATLVALGASGCTGGGGSSAEDVKGGAPSVSFAQPGRYSTLREPCGTVPSSTLKDLLPGTSSLPADQQARVLKGTPAVTYDTDRRVGCSWKATSMNASYALAIDIERVVSYDPAVSDVDRAKQVYAQKEEAADVPTTSSPTLPPLPTGTGTTVMGSAGATGATDATGTTGSADSGEASGDDGASPSVPPDGDESGVAGAPGSDTALQPRELGGIGDDAYIDDKLTPSGSAATSRTVSVVFRTSNVIVTVTYSAQPTRPGLAPDRKELQDKTQSVAKSLVAAFNG